MNVTVNNDRRGHTILREEDGESVAPRVLVIDNYDSFAYNLVQYVGEILVRLGGNAGDVLVRRNDAVDIADISRIDPDGIVVSPGPGRPEHAGVSMPVFSELAYPTLGVCLGHQALCGANGTRVSHAEAVVHGKSSLISHDGEGLFDGLPAPLEVGRYHSLAIDREDLVDSLEVTALTQENPSVEHTGNVADPVSDGVETDVVMGVRHRDRPHFGVQFHPESILTAHGKRLVENFCLLCTTT